MNFESFLCSPLDFPLLVKIFFKPLCPKWEKYWPALVLKGHLICFAVTLFIPTGVSCLSLTVVRIHGSHSAFDLLKVTSDSAFFLVEQYSVFSKGYFCSVNITLNLHTMKYACSHSLCVSRVCLP